MVGHNNIWFWAVGSALFLHKTLFCHRNTGSDDAHQIKRFQIKIFTISYQKSECELSERQKK